MWTIWALRHIQIIKLEFHISFRLICIAEIRQVLAELLSTHKLCALVKARVVQSFYSQMWVNLEQIATEFILWGIVSIHAVGQQKKGIQSAILVSVISDQWSMLRVCLHPCIRDVAIHISVFYIYSPHMHVVTICLPSQTYVIIVHAYAFITLACSLVMASRIATMASKRTFMRTGNSKEEFLNW